MADSRTGAVLATISPPAGSMFGGVTGAADDRTFVLDTVPSGNYPARSHAWYLLRIDKGTGLTRLPVAGPAVSAQIQGLALSPDGRTLAVLFQPGALSAPLTLQTYSLASGRALRTWTTPSPNGSPVSMTPNSDNYAVLSWIGERALAFRYPVYTVPYSLRTLSLASKGGDFLKASEFAMADPGDRHDCAGPRIATDGRTVVCGTLGSATGSCVQEQPGFDLWSTATGKLIRVLYRYAGSCQTARATVLWAGRDGTAIGVLAVYTYSGNQTRTKTTVGLISPGRFTPLRVSVTAATAMDGDIAF